MSNSTKRSRKYRDYAPKKYLRDADKEESEEPEDDEAEPGNEKDSTLGNAVGKPRAAKSSNPIVELLNEVEATTRDSPYWAESQRKPYNPDDLVMRRMDYSIYDTDMPNDDQISVCLELKKDLVLGSGYEFVIDGDTEQPEAEPGEDPAQEGEEPEAIDPTKPALPKKPEVDPTKAPEDDPTMPPPGATAVAKPIDPVLDAKKQQDELMKAIRKDLEIAFSEDPEVDIEQSFAEILTAYENGFSLTEKVWKKRDDGSMTIKHLKTRHPATWLIHTDVHGNVERYEQRQQGKSLDVKAESLIHYVNNSRYQNPYGKSDLRAAHDAWFIKREIIKYYAIFLEKHASPTPVAKYPTNTPPEQVTELFNVIKKFQTKTAICIPKEVEVDFLESKSNGEAFVKAINIFNMFIGRALFIPDLLGFQGSETSGGSYSLGKDQMAILYKHIHKRRQTFEKLVNMHLVKPFVIANYGLVDKFPKFRLKEISDEKTVEYAKLWIEAIKGKFWKPSADEINFFRKLIKFPVGPVEEQPEPAVSPTLPDGSPNPAFDPAVEAAKAAKKGANGLPEKEEALGKKPGGEGAGLGDKKPSPNAPKVEGKDGAASSEKKNFSSKVFDGTPGDYAKKVNFKLLKSGLDTMYAKIMDEAKPLFREIYDDLFAQIRDKKLLQKQDLAKIDTIKVKKTAALKTLLKRRFVELRNDMFRQARSEIVKGASKYAAPLPHEKFMEFLEEETFQYVGDWEYGVKKKVRLALIEAIKDGKALSTVLDVLDDDGIKLATTSLERFARTKLTEVMNRARKEAFEETGVVAAYQFSAIMDDRVSDICGGLHGCIFEKDQAPTPPLHFNCRSVLIPVTKYEDYKVTKATEGQNIDKFIDDNIGDGFSRQ